MILWKKHVCLLSNGLEGKYKVRNCYERNWNTEENDYATFSEFLPIYLKMDIVELGKTQRSVEITKKYMNGFQNRL